eukprot:TRINITY_DN20490_c0_g1_i1.p1 TRINITY_DN20490_c0_g1~~TRINITY_DN20490_c0_g1_i1.p1  ORF type:complete len:168 (-),score=38.25 TRINITY_DN20490_c0_g1_i1:8-511(-)
MKMLGMGSTAELTPPADVTIRTLYVGGIKDNSGIGEEDLRAAFFAYGEPESVRMAPKSMCAFVTFRTRDEAEKAAAVLKNKVLVKGISLNLQWGKPQGQGQSAGLTPSLTPAAPSGAQEGFGGAAAAAAPAAAPQFPPLFMPPIVGFTPTVPHYASQNPDRRGTRAE